MPLNNGYLLGGLPLGSATGNSAQTLNAANARRAYSFLAPASSKTLTSVAVYVTTVTGTPTAAEFDAVLMLADPTTGNPDGSAIQTVDCNQTPTANSVHTWTFSTALTVGARYWIVFQNTNASPASHNMTLRSGGGGSALGYQPNQVMGGWAVTTSTDGGSSWTGALNHCHGLRVGCNDSSYDGYPFQNSAVTAVGVGIYSARELGNRFTTPADVKLRVAGLAFQLQTKTNSPTGSVRGRLYAGTSLLATSASLYATSPAVSTYEFRFGTVQVLDPSTLHRAVVGETTQSDVSTNRYNLNAYTIFNDANSKALLPFGDAHQTYFDGSSWSDTDTEYVPFALILDPADPFDVTSGGSAGGAHVMGGTVVR